MNRRLFIPFPTLDLSSNSSATILTKLHLEMDVRSSSQYIAKNATFCKVDEAGCKKVSSKISERMKEKGYSTSSWAEHPLNPKEKTAATVDWIFTVDTLNFSFWSELDNNHRFTVHYNHNDYTGYWSLPAAINKALDRGIPITSPEFWISPRFTLEVLAQVFYSATNEQIPLLQERYDALVEAGNAIKKAGAKSFAEIVERASNSADTLIETVRRNMSSYNDVFEYKGIQVRILKRAQILVGDLWACFNGRDYGQFDDIDNVTMFADYRVPQILHDLGCIEYSKELKDKIYAGELIESGSEMEIELRGCSIWAVEVIRSHIENVNSVLLDFYLWDTAKEVEEEAKVPCHRTRSVFY